MLFLSHLDKKENPLPLNHVHTGNIFIISGGKCQLGGFENSLLGYSARPPCDGSILAYENAGKFNAILFGNNYCMNVRLNICFMKVVGKFANFHPFTGDFTVTISDINSLFVFLTGI